MDLDRDRLHIVAHDGLGDLGHGKGHEQHDEDHGHTQADARLGPLREGLLEPVGA